MALAAWQILDDGPRRLAAGAVELEKNLEDWIARDPRLIDPGLLVVARQLHVDGGFLDLLCVDPQGRATVIEIKRGRLNRETIAQAIDYASSIAAMPPETLAATVNAYLGGGEPDHPGVGALREGDAVPRDVAVVVVGVGQEPGLERMIDFLGTGFGFPIRAVLFDVFDLGDGAKVLVREESEPEQPSASPRGPANTEEAVVAAAGGPASANGRRMLALADAARRNGLHVKPYKWSLMFTPQQHKNRYLVTVWSREWGEPALTYSADAFAEFFAIEAEAVRAILGPDDATGTKHPLTSDGEAERFAAGLDATFAAIAAAQGERRGEG